MASDAPRRFYYKRNRFKQLHAFCHAARTQSVSAAAELIFLSQPAVSLLIKALEDDLGVALFERRGPRISLTPEGRILHELAEPLVDGIETLPAAFLERCNKVEAGQLDIAASESTILYILPPVVKRFAALFPRVRFKLHNTTGRGGLALLRSGTVDLAVGSILEVPEDVEYQPMLQYQPVLITPPEHPLSTKPGLTLEDIAGHALILPPRHLSTWRIVEQFFRQRNVAYSVAVEAGSWEVIKEYVKAGVGVSIVASICLQRDENLAVRPLGDWFPKRRYGLAVMRDGHLSTAAQKFIDLLHEHCAQQKAPE
ncbi:MAG: LysR family transcriptional regulator [Gammaproteobacteria bacterium]